jgi:hypothetical protein
MSAMKPWTARRLVILPVLLFSVATASVAAQWPQFPTVGVPKTADGKPDLTAPTPKTAGGKPDFSGLWQNVTTFPRSDSVSGTGGAPRADGTIPVIMTLFWDVKYGLKEPVPLRPWAAELRNQREAAGNKDNPDALCLPMGFMQFHNHPQPRKIVQTPTLMVIMYEANYGLRQIFMDGRPLPVNDPQPWWYGYSVGKWDGAELVVETTGFRDDGWLDIYGSPLTDAAKLTERFRRKSFGVLEVEVTVDDPKAYTKPFTVRLDQRLMLDNEMIEFICGENERSVAHMVGK